MSDVAHSFRHFHLRLRREANLFVMKKLPQMLLAWVVVAAVLAALVLAWPDAVHFSQTADGYQRASPHIAVKMRNTELPIKCVQPDTVWNTMLLQNIPRQRVVAEDGTFYIARGRIDRERWEKTFEDVRYPCADSTLDAYYVEEMEGPPAPAGTQ